LVPSGTSVGSGKAAVGVEEDCAILDPKLAEKQMLKSASASKRLQDILI
jgi:hypothetical protein